MNCISKMALVLAAVSSAALGASSAPTVTSLSFSQDYATRVAAVEFTLGEAAVVTLDVQTNGTSIGWRNFRGGITGCALGKVNPAGAYRLEWKPFETWLDAPAHLPTNSVTAVVTAWSPDNTPDFMDIDLTAQSNVTYYVSESDLPCDVTNDMYKTTHLLMKRIHAANKLWVAGSPETEKGRSATAKKWENQRNVVLSQDYYIGVFETTQDQWKRMTGSASLPSDVKIVGAALPMGARTYNNLRGTWNTANAWPAKNRYVTDASDIGKARILTGVVFDLPTEAQWEYACRGGTTTAYNTGTDGNSSGMLADADLSRIARWLGNSVSEGGAVTNFAAVGSYEPNGYGLYDTIGNVSELCIEFRTESDGTTTYDPVDNDLVDPVGGEPASSASSSRVTARGSNYQTTNNSTTWSAGYGVNILMHRSAYRGSLFIAPNTTSHMEIGFRLVAPVGAWAPLNSEVTETPAQSVGSRVVKFKYDLDADAIVTLKVLVDGEPVDGAASCVGGDVNRPVAAGSGKMISWYPDRSLERLDVASGRVGLKIEKWSVSDPPPYMALNLSAPAMTNIAYYDEGELPGGATNEMFKTDWLLMRRIPAKDVVWWMGVATNAAGKSVETETVRAREMRHQVKLSADYYIGVFPVTERQYQLTMGTSPTNANTLTMPALLTHNDVRPHGNGVWPGDGHNVSATKFLGILRKRSDGYQFDMPTEAQWEYACRAMTGSAFCDGNEIGAANNGYTLANVKDYAWLADNSDGVRMPVGLKRPNLFGLYDMHGNLWEWCLDFYDEKYGLSAAELVAAQTTPVEDPVGPSKNWNDNIVLRGGCSSSPIVHARSGDRTAAYYCAYLYTANGNIGSTIRVVCPIAPVEE